ncbi:hypothetical protein H2198_007055 [Neophaeococcomyces mojaviensis]|uniref:Uncharacterized protein n=1 Tax=Neophaeococcomyces mojaviensis TaxID=3383035 RepID=A0ACC3A176_9EURO|nr:hypothetical protein H2198_007055 [Knufia sp. JES_112]
MHLICTLASLAVSFPVHALAAPASPLSTNTHPFTSLITFGDELSDNGNGSYAHGISNSLTPSSPPNPIYGYGTWTNGPIAASYLSTSLDIPNTASYAFGGCCGGSKSGATLSNTYTPSQASVPSVLDQIANFTAELHAGMVGDHTNTFDPSTALAFIWAGQNDLSAHTDAFWLDDPHNSLFASNLSAYTVTAVQQLLALGIPNVLVANIYPKHIAPVTSTYLCGGSDNGCTRTWGQVITAANTQLQQTLASTFGDKVIYYDSFSFVSELAAHAPSYGFTAPLSSICDGQGDANWDACMTTGKASDGSTEIVGWNDFFWMNFVQPTTRVHELVGEDMAKAVMGHFGM